MKEILMEQNVEFLKIFSNVCKTCHFPSLKSIITLQQELKLPGQLVKLVMRHPLSKLKSTGFQEIGIRDLETKYYILADNIREFNGMLSLISICHHQV